MALAPSLGDEANSEPVRMDATSCPPCRLAGIERQAVSLFSVGLCGDRVGVNRRANDMPF